MKSYNGNQCAILVIVIAASATYNAVQRLITKLRYTIISSLKYTMCALEIFSIFLNVAEGITNASTCTINVSKF